MRAKLSCGMLTPVCASHVGINALTYTGTLLHDMAYISPTTVLFFNHNPNKLIVACSDGIFIVHMSIHSTQPFSSAPQRAYYHPHALTLSDDDTVLVAGNGHSAYSVCGYDTASRTRLWIHSTAPAVGAVCMLVRHVLVTEACNSTLVLDRNTGAHVSLLQKSQGSIFGLGVIESL